MLEVGTLAPDFTLMNQDGSPVTLSQFRGRKVILYFYPRDNTAGCSRQACAFNAAKEELNRLNAVVLGVSKDSQASHRKFADKYELGFDLLTDPERTVIEPYGVWQEKKQCGKVSMGVVRSTYLIDENGVVELALPKVKPDTNAAQLVEYLTGKQEG